MVLVHSLTLKPFCINKSMMNRSHIAIKNTPKLKLNTKKCTYVYSPRIVNKIHCKAQMHPTNNNNSHLCNKKNIALSGIFFSNLMIYTIVRDLKDVIFITECGASFIPFVKTWINLPISIGFIFFYNILLNKFKFQKTYLIVYTMLSSLYSFVGLYLYPIRDSLRIQSSNVLISNWVSTLYYVLSPIWGTIVVSVLFWSFANQYTDVDDAKAVYPILGMIANIALILAGFIMSISGNLFSNNWELNVQILSVVNVVMSLLSIYLYDYITRLHSPIKSFSISVSNKKGFFESFHELKQNPFIKNMVIMISCYGLLVGFYESIWKHYLKIYLVSPIKYSQFMGMVSSCTGFFTIGMMTLGSVWMKKSSWTKIALITPVSMFGMGVLFYTSILTKSIPIISFTGATLTIFLKGAKYSLFDPCKEIAYIPMDEDIKTRGKATVEILSAPIGKSGSNCILQVLILLFGSLEASVYIIGGLYTLTALYWISSTVEMGEIVENKDANIKHLL
jgi:AAA family ATP:ADP antiporter